MGVAEQKSHGVDGVDAHVGQGPTPGVLLLGKPATRPPMGVDAVACGADDLADCRHALLEPQHIAIKPPTVGHYQGGAVVLGHLVHLQGLVGIHGHRFFDHHMHAGAQGRDALWGMQIIGRGNHDGIDVPVANQIADFGVLAGDAKCLGEICHRYRLVIDHGAQGQAQITGGLGVYFADIASAGKCNTHKMLLSDVDTRDG